MLDLGLCICFYDLLEAGDPIIYPAEGSCHQAVMFRLVMFQPFIGEILVGRVVTCTEEGVRVTLGFFDEIFVPASLLQSPSLFDKVRSVWLWNLDTGGDEDEEFAMEVGYLVRTTYPPDLPELYYADQIVPLCSRVSSQVRVRVRKVEFTGPSPSLKAPPHGVGETRPDNSSGQTYPPVSGDGILHPSTAPPPSGALPLRVRSSSMGSVEDALRPPVMRIVGSCNEDGLGMLSWWTS